jgi:ribonuclease HI
MSGQATDRKGKAVLPPRCSSNKRKEADSLASWNAPPQGWCKVNVDGACPVDGGEAGLGVVIRNCAGTVLLSSWRWVDHASDAEEIEAMACREGLTLAGEWCHQPIILESDYLSVIKNLAKPEDQRAKSVFIIRESLEAAARCLRVVFNHVKRERNLVAHQLAQMAKRLRHSAVWHSRVPFCVESLIAHGCKTMSSI